MGVESKLRGKADRTRVVSAASSYDNGDRKLINRDQCPSGCDEYVWHLGMYYREQAIERGFDAERMPVVYTEIYERVLTDPLLSGMLVSADGGTIPRVRTRAADTQDIPGVTPVTIIEDMIDYYFSSYSSNKPPSVDNFCSTTVFEECTAVIVSKHENTYLKTHGIRTVQVLPHAKPSRRTPEEDEAARIRFRKPGDEEEAWSKARAFVAGHKEG